MVAQTQVPFDLGKLDINSIPLSALEEIEAYAGIGLQDIVALANGLQASGGMMSLPATQIVVLMYLIGIASNPDYTIAHARAINLGQMNALNQVQAPTPLQKLRPSTIDVTPVAPSRRTAKTAAPPKARAPKVKPGPLSVVPPMTQDDMEAAAEE